MKRFSRLFLHIGPHKTGSSAIQALCDENRDLLARRHGILYPSGRWHAQLGSCISEDKLSYIYNLHAGHTDLGVINASDEAYLAELEAQFAATTCDRAVLSYEGFVDLQPAAVVNLRDWLIRHSDNVQLIAYCRHPLSFAPSEKSQRIRMGLPPRGEDGCEFLIPRFIGYFQKYEAAFGHDAIWLTEFAREALYNGDVRLDFLAKLSIADSDVDEFRLAAEGGNESLSAEAACIGEAMARLAGPSLQQNMFYMRYSALLACLDGAPIALTPEDERAIMAAAGPHLDYLQESFGLALTPPRLGSAARGRQFLFSEAAIDALARFLLHADDLAQAYRWLLGRPLRPEESAYGNLIDAHGDWLRLRKNIMCSEEFLLNLARHAAANSAFPVQVGTRSPADPAPRQVRSGHSDE